MSYQGNETCRAGYCAIKNRSRCAESDSDRWRYSANSEVLRGLLKTDENACRLGEVALVPNSSPISQSRILYYNTVLDENAASHIAFGQAWSVGIQSGVSLGSEELTALGTNQSMIHVDMMVGSDKIDVDGIMTSGKTEPVMRNGEFVKVFEGN